MGEMFSNAANFSGIADEALKVGKVLQKAFVEVNEEGSEAAAVTGELSIYYFYRCVSLTSLCFISPPSICPS